MIDVAGVKKVIEAFIVPGNTTHSVILGRPWLRSVQAIGLYENDEYWIQDQNGLHHRLVVSGKAMIKAPEMFLADDVDPDTLEMDEAPIAFAKTGNRLGDNLHGIFRISWEVVKDAAYRVAPDLDLTRGLECWYGHNCGMVDVAPRILYYEYLGHCTRGGNTSRECFNP